MHIKILQHPDFHAHELPLNITTLKQMQCSLPLMTLGSHKVKINLTYTPSTSKLFKECFTFSVLDHIQHILNNLSIYPKLYFGPGIEIEEKLELWHGQIIACVIIYFLVLYQAGDFVLYHNHAVWLTEEQTTICIDDVIQHIGVWLKDSPKPIIKLKKFLYTHSYHKLGGLYLQFGNMNNEKVFVSGGLGMCTADLPQGNNDIAGVQQHNAEHGRCSCEKLKKHLQSLHLQKNILDHLIHNRHIQTPQDSYPLFSRDIYQESGAITQWHINYYDSIQFTVKHEADIYIIYYITSWYRQSYEISAHQDDLIHINPF
nr:11678_t:CDS:2 [Entrophospora candida]